MENMRIFNLNSMKKFLNTNQEVDEIYKVQWCSFVEIMITMEEKSYI